jgi:nicotinamidase-related amidase
MKHFSILTLVLLFAISMATAQENNTKKTEMNAALLVIDVQNQFLPMMSKEDQEAALEYMKWAIMVSRQHGIPVIRIYHTSKEYGPAEGTAEFEFSNKLPVLDTDPKIIKTYGSAFNKTALDSLLKAKNINTLFMCGLSSTGCVLATFMDSKNYDYKSFLIKDALIGPSAEQTNQIESILNAIDLETINFMFEISQ